MLSVVIVTGAIQERSRTLKGPILFEMNYGKISVYARNLVSQGGIR